MAFPANQPGFVYTAPIDWHPDPVQVVSGGDPAWGTYWHPTSDGVANAQGTILEERSGNLASFRWERPFGASNYPSDDPLCGFNGAVVWGRSGVDWWPPFGCPAIPFGTFLDLGGDSSHQRSYWEVFNSPRSGAGGGIQTVTGTGSIGGWLVHPWGLFSNYDTWMNDEALEDEWSAAVEATRPFGDGWSIEWEAFHPFFESLEYAPDEPGDAALTDGYLGLGEGYQGYVSWSRNPVDVWAYYAQSGAEPAFFPGLPGIGEEIVAYEGGSVDWEPVPPEWVPTQVDDYFDCEFETPEYESAEYWDGSDVLTLKHGAIANAAANAGGEGTTLGEHRQRQILAFRASWRLPKFRWLREGTSVVRQYPRDDEQGWGSGMRLYPPTKANRSVGGIQ